MSFGQLLPILIWILLFYGQAVAATTPPAQAPLASERLALIKQRGSLVVGVKTDYPPFGQLNTAGQPEGFEHDLAYDLARRLGVSLVKKVVSAANRLQKLEDGTVDVVLATTGDTADRRKVVTMIEPNYYSSGVTLFMAPYQSVNDWNDIRGQRVCATQGSYFNRVMAQRYLLELQVFNNPRDAKLAVKDKRCIGYVFDNTAIDSYLRLPEWAGYKAPLPPVLSTPWAIAISRSEKGTDFEHFLGDAVADWHRTGFAIEREQAWGLSPSRFLVSSRLLWTQKDTADQYLCMRNSTGEWPIECRNPIFLSSKDVTGFHQLGLWFKEQTGVDLSLVYDDYDRNWLLRGLGTTLVLMLLCVSLSLLMGVVGALVVEARIFLLSRLFSMASVVGRMTPPLLTMYILIFGVGSMLVSAYSVNVPPFAVVVWCLAFYTGSSIMTALLFSADVRRQTVTQFHLRWDNLREVVRSSSGHVTAALVNVSKATMIASAFAVPELLSAVTTIMADNGNVTVMMNALLLTFFVLVFATYRLLNALEKKLLAGLK